MDLASTFADLTEGLSSGGSLLLLTDYDGSLTPIVDEPADARLSREARDDLRALARSPRVRVAVVSGRALADLRGRVSVKGVIYAGCHGLEIEGRGLSFRHPDAEKRRVALAGVARVLGERTAAIPGMIVEAKGLAVAVHFRQVAREDLPLATFEVEQAVAQAGADLRIFRGHEVLEVLPAVDWNKGRCALWIWSRIGPSLPRPAMMLYMGDDSTDELAFRALAGKAVTVRVGRPGEPTSAGYRFAQVHQVLRLLSALAEELGGRPGR